MGGIKSAFQFFDHEIKHPLTHRERQTYLVNGYIRKIKNLESPYVIPTELVDLCFKYYFRSFSLFMCYPSNYKTYRSKQFYRYNNGLGIKISKWGGCSCYHFFSNVGFNINSGRYIFSVKCVKSYYNGYYGYALYIFSCRNPDIYLREIYFANEAGTRYSYHGDGRICAKGENGEDLFDINEKDTVRKGDMVYKQYCKWGEGDIITTILDTNRWTIQYFKNMKKVCDELTIIPNKYYAGIQLHSDNEFQMTEIHASTLQLDN